MLGQAVVTRKDLIQVQTQQEHDCPLADVPYIDVPYVHRIVPYVRYLHARSVIAYLHAITDTLSIQGNSALHVASERYAYRVREERDGSDECEGRHDGYAVQYCVGVDHKSAAMQWR